MAPVAPMAEPRPRTTEESQVTEVPEPSPDPHSSSFSLKSVPRSMMPALNAQLQGQVDVPADLDIGSDH